MTHSRLLSISATLSLAASFVGACAASTTGEPDGDAGGVHDGGGSDNEPRENPRVEVSRLTFGPLDLPLTPGAEDRDACNFDTTDCVGEFLSEPYPVDELCDFRNRRLFEFRCDIADCRSSIRYSRPSAIEPDERVRMFGSTNCRRLPPPCEDLVGNNGGTPIGGVAVVHFERETLENALGCELTIPPRGWSP